MSAPLLLDTEVALAALAAPARLPRALRKALDAADVYVSAASILEVGLRLGAAAARDVLAALEPAGFRALEVRPEHAARAAALATGGAGALAALVAAQAELERLTLVTRDWTPAARRPARTAASTRSPRRGSARARPSARGGRGRR